MWACPLLGVKRTSVTGALMSANDPKRANKRVVQLLRATVTIKRAELVVQSVKSHIYMSGTLTFGADGKDYRADFVHAPFQEILSSRVPARQRGSSSPSDP